MWFNGQSDRLEDSGDLTMNPCLAIETHGEALIKPLLQSLTYLERPIISQFQLDET